MMKSALMSSRRKPVATQNANAEKLRKDYVKAAARNKARGTANPAVATANKANANAAAKANDTAAKQRTAVAPPSRMSMQERQARANAKNDFSRRASAFYNANPQKLADVEARAKSGAVRMDNMVGRMTNGGTTTISNHQKNVLRRQAELREASVKQKVQSDMRRDKAQKMREQQQAVMKKRRSGVRMAKGGIVKANCGASMTPANVSKGK